jgi:hypothetical protein
MPMQKCERGRFARQRLFVICTVGSAGGALVPDCLCRLDDKTQLVALVGFGDGISGDR